MDLVELCANVILKSTKTIGFVYFDVESLSVTLKTGYFNNL